MTKLADFTLEELMIFCISVLGALGGLLTVIFKSKCKTIDCCCIKCIRDTELIYKEDKLALGKTESKEKEKEKLNKDNTETNNEPETEELFNKT